MTPRRWGAAATPHEPAWSAELHGPSLGEARVTKRIVMACTRKREYPVLYPRSTLYV